MANEEGLGPRKTIFVLVIVVGCFAVLWPRILSPLIFGPSREQLKPNQFDREAGCCEVIFEKDMVMLELLNEVCSSTTHTDKLSPYSAAECRKAVNETCGVDIAAFLKRSDNVGKTSKILIETMRNSNSSCLREHFGVPVWDLGPHIIQNSWTQQDTSLKQERPPIRGAGPHPALRERGRAIPPGVPSAPPARGPVPMPPHARVRSSPLSVYFELDIKPPPIPGMRPPLGSPGGPVPAPKTSMGFVMPIYTICIIVFFVYTLSKILFKRTGTAYDPISPDPQFRRRVFRDDSRTSPDKLVVTAISGLVAEVQQQMEANYAQNQQRQDVQQDNQTRPYTNGTIIHNSGPVHIVASEYQEQAKDKSPESQKEKEQSPVPEFIPGSKKEELEIKESPEELKESAKDNTESVKESSQVEKEPSSEKGKESSPEPVVEPKESTPEPKEASPAPKEASPEPKEASLESTHEPKEATPEIKHDEEEEEEYEEEIVEEEEDEVVEPIKSKESTLNETDQTDKLINAADDVKVTKNGDIRKTEEFLQQETNAVEEEKKEKQSTPELLEEAIKDDEDLDDKENSSVKVVGMEVRAHQADGGACPEPPPPPPLPPQPSPQPRAHEATSVQSIFLETEIPQQSRVLVADFAEDRADKPQPTKHSPMVVSGKMTLSLIQDAPRDTPERDQESTMDDFTTASALTQNAAEKRDEESDEEIEEEIEIEEIEEEVEEVEEEEDDVEQDKKEQKKTK